MKKFVLMVLCMALMLTAFVSNGSATLNAYANGNDDAPPTDNLGYTSFYYFSNNPDCSTYFNGFMRSILSTYGIRGCKRHLIDLSAYSDYYDSFYTEFTNNSYDLISDALIVFEMETPFKKQDPNIEILFVDVLKDVFEGWKDNNCKIMFICKTDESRFVQYNELLDYVDIHINTDLMTLLMYHVVGQFLSESGVPGDDTTLIINKNANYVVEEYIVPLCRYIYNLPDYDPDYDTSLEVLVYAANTQDYNKIRVIVQSETSYPYYVDYKGNGISPTISNTLLDLALTIDFNNTYAIGAFNHTTTSIEISDWMNDFDDIYDDYAETFSIFIENTTGSPIRSNYSNLTVYELGDELYDFYQGTDFQAIFNNFVGGASLSVYDNYPGRCIVTYKPLTFGPDGWLNINFNILSCWDMYSIRY